MLVSFQIPEDEAVTVTFEQIVPLLIGMLIGLLVSLIAGSWWSTRAHPHNLEWLNAHDRVMSELLILGVFALGVFVAYALLRG